MTPLAAKIADYLANAPTKRAALQAYVPARCHPGIPAADYAELTAIMIRVHGVTEWEAGMGLHAAHK